MSLKSRIFVARRFLRDDSVKVLVIMMFVGSFWNRFLLAQVKSSGHSPVQQCANSVICPGEELTYEVTWMNVHLGQIRLKVNLPTRENNVTLFHATAYIDSYDGLPFVNIHAVDKTVMDTNFYSVGFIGYDKEDDKWRVEKSHYNLPHHQIIIEKYFQKSFRDKQLKPSTYDTLRLNDGLVQDGLSILFFARANIHRGQDIKVPTVVYGKMGRTVLHFRNVKTSDEEIEVMDGTHIRVIPFDGKAEFEGIFGLTGDFKGWFSADPASVPIKAEMKVLVGSVKIELVKWKRDGWNPPTELEAKH